MINIIKEVCSNKLEADLKLSRVKSNFNTRVNEERLDKARLVSRGLNSRASNFTPVHRPKNNVLGAEDNFKQCPNSQPGDREVKKPVENFSKIFNTRHIL